MQGAFSEPVLHKLVLSKIDFELSDEIWCYINEGFGHFWDVEVGIGNDFYFDEACQSIQKHLDSVGVLFPSEKLATILDIMFDFIEQIPGAFLDDDAVLVPENKNINEFCGCYSDFESSETLPAITDNDTNIVFISKWLKDELPSFFERFTNLMDEMGIQWSLLKATRDIWARDYMPVQLSEKEFIKYKYSPNYLHGDKEHITDCEAACKALGINYRETDLIIDGGNITPCAEFNIYEDPHGAQCVFKSGIKIKMFGLDVTLKAYLTDDDIAEIVSYNNKTSRFFESSNKLIYAIQERHSGNGLCEHDTCPIVYLAHPELFTGKPCGIYVETQGEITMGKTVADLYTDHKYEDRHCEAYIDIDREEFVKIIKEAYKAY